MPGEEYTLEKWHEWGHEGEPDKGLAVQEHEAFVAVLESEGVEILWLNEGTSIQTSSTYDPALITDEGAVMMKCGRPERWPEVMPMARRLLELEIPIIGWIRGDGRLDGGDTLWLDQETLLVGRGYRSNDEGFRQIRNILDGIVTAFCHFELPHWCGVHPVLHLMSVVNLCSDDVALVYPRAMPIRLRALLLDRGYRLVECPDAEFDTQGCNALTLRPGTVLVYEGNPVTTARLKEAGVKVIECRCSELARRFTGPTCATRPLLRAGSSEA
jgi:N-dimethylarginine dimethylaminohydrolase